MENLKKYWKYILIALLFILFVAKCSSSGNYERKYNKSVEYCEFVKDSLKNVQGNSFAIIDSLNTEIKLKNSEIESFKQQLDIYKNQNDKLNESNRQLSGKNVVVNIDKK